MERRGRKDNRIYWGLLALSLLFYLWLAAQIPYTHDDWDWGLPVGLEQLVTASLNSRYAGNLTEVLLTRSPWLKTLVMGVVMAALPAAVTGLCCACDPEGAARAPALRPLLLATANLLMLCTHILIWQQAFGWVAGFSNFGLSSLLLCLYHWMLARFGRGEGLRGGPARLALLFLFGAVIQLYLENITVYVLLVSLGFLAWLLLKKRRVPGDFRALLAGNALGTAVMFSSGIYSALISTGKAVGDYRQLTFDLHAPLYAIVWSLLKRFLLLYPASLWVAGWLPMLGVLLLLALIARRRRPGLGLPIAITNGLLGLYILAMRLWGDFGRVLVFGVRANNLLSAFMGLAVFAAVTGELLLLWRGKRETMWMLLLLWLARPLVMAPMAAVNTVDPRSYQTTEVLCWQLVLLLMLQLRGLGPLGRRKLLMGALILALTLSVGRMALVYTDIGSTKRLREDLIAQARLEPQSALVLPKYRFADFLWLPDPVSPDNYRVDFFREFYRIPAETELWFESWGEVPEALYAQLNPGQRSFLSQSP